MKLTFDHNSQSFPINLIPTGKSYRVTVGDKTVEVEIIQANNGRLDLRLIRPSDPLHLRLRAVQVSDSESAYTAYVSSDGAKRWVTINGQTVVLTKSSGAKRKGSSHDHAAGLTAPMPGLVRSVNVRQDEVVSKGQTLMVLEAMKMEIRIQAKGAGVVKKLLVQQGQTVERDQVLIEIE